MYINILTLIQINRAELQSLFPETSFPPEGEIESSAISWTGYAVLIYAAVPDLSLLQSYVPGEVVFSEGKFVQQWLVVEPTESDWQVYNTNKVNTLLRQANAQVTAIQGRVDMINDSIEIGEDEPGWVAELPVRKAQLTLWKKYRIDLNKVILQSGWASNVNWPIIPTTYTDEMSSTITTNIS